MIINFKKTHVNAVIPSKAHPWDAAFDLTAVSFRIDEQYGFIEYDTGLACEIDRGFCGLIYPRSSISKYDLALANGIGLVDSGYLGNLLLRFKPTLRFTRSYSRKVIIKNNPYDLNIYNPGDRIGQLKIVPVDGIEFKEVMELNKSDRGTGSFGSSGV
jgi:dUTP pyrophosphatase